MSVPYYSTTYLSWQWRLVACILAFAMRINVEYNPNIRRGGPACPPLEHGGAVLWCEFRAWEVG
jgi:hypothetical protein